MIPSRVCVCVPPGTGDGTPVRESTGAEDIPDARKGACGNSSGRGGSIFRSAVCEAERGEVKAIQNDL